jgi:hypothetical protein
VIEGDRIRTPASQTEFPTAPMAVASMPGTDPIGSVTLPEGHQWVHGVQIDPLGQTQAYAICERTRPGLVILKKIVSAENCYLHTYTDRLDQVRGISPLAPAVNTFRDCYEATEYALAKAKISQLFGIKFTREDTEPLPPSTSIDDGSLTEPNEDGSPRYSIDFGRGQFALDLDPGDDAAFMETATPSGRPPASHADRPSESATTTPSRWNLPACTKAARTPASCGAVRVARPADRTGSTRAMNNDDQPRKPNLLLIGGAAHGQWVWLPDTPYTIQVLAADTWHDYRLRRLHLPDGRLVPVYVSWWPEEITEACAVRLWTEGPPAGPVPKTFAKLPPPWRRQP